MGEEGEFGKRGPALPQRPWENINFSDTGVSQGEFKEVTLGTKWSEGERRFGFTADNPASQKLEINLGSTAQPNEVYGPVASFSRTMSIADAAFVGDGEGGLAAIRATTVATATSQGQAIGAAFSAVTFSSYEEATSLADAFGLTSLGISREGTRTGGGGFFNGRRETVAGRTTGLQVVSDNETLEDQEYTGVLPGTKIINLNGVGTGKTAVGLVFPKTGIGVHTLFGVCIEAPISNTVFRDDSSAPWSIRIRGTHAEAALAVNAGAGQVVIGAEKAKLATPLFEIYTETTLDPMYSFGTNKGVSVRGQLIINSTGNLEAFAVAANNAFLNGTVAGDSGLTYTAGKTFHIGAGNKVSMLRMQEAKIGLFGVAPVARAAAIPEPELVLLKIQESVNKIREVLKNIGITE